MNLNQARPAQAAGAAAARARITRAHRLMLLTGCALATLSAGLAQAGEDGVSYGSSGSAQNSSIATGLGAIAASSTEGGGGAAAQGNFSIAIGGGDGTTGASGAWAEALYSTALGAESHAADVRSTAVGVQARALASASSAFGNQAWANAAGATAVGGASAAEGLVSVAVGANSRASADSSIALGSLAQSTSISAIAIGKSSFVDVSSDGSIAIGAQTKVNANSTNSVAVGAANQITGQNSGAFGTGQTVNGNGTFAIGDPNTVNGHNSFVFGNGNAVNTATNAGAGTAGWGNNIQVIGTNNVLASTAAAGGSSVLGIGNTVNAQNAIAIGNSNTVTGASAFVFGEGSTASGNGAMAFGGAATASGTSAMAFGATANAGGLNAIALGGASISSAVQSVAIGQTSKASAGSTVALGAGAQATAAEAVAFGAGAQASALNSVALGANSVADQANTVSVGAPGMGRRIVNVADGNIASGSNDAVNGGQIFALRDEISSGGIGLVRQSAAGQPITVGAATDGKFVDFTGTAGRRSLVGVQAIGIGTDSPQQELHMRVGDTPTIRFEQAGGPFTPQTWDIGANEANFFIRDLTGGSTLPFRIRPGAPTSSIDIGANGHVALGFAEFNGPLASLHVYGVETADTFANFGPSTQAGSTGLATAAGTEGLNVGYGAATLGAGSGFLNAFSATGSDGRLVFATDGTTRMTLASDGSVAIGTGAQAAANSVAIGAGSIATDANTISFGSSGSERRLVNVAAGINATDAVNMSQLAALQGQVSNGSIGLVQQSGPGQAITVGAATDGTVVSFTGTAGTRTLTGVTAGTLSAGSTDAVNGSQLFATNQQVAANTTAIGDLSSVVAGLSASNAYVKVNSSGPTPTASGQNSIAIGPSAVASGDSAMALGNGAQATQAGALALGQNAASTGTNAIAIGTGATATGSVAVGVQASAANGGAAFGDGAVATASKATAIGPGASATGANSVAIGAGSVATQANTVSFGAPGNERRITGVAPGVGPSDAATFGQVQSIASGLQSQITELDNRTTRATSGVAMAFAMAGAPTLITGERFAVTGNWGTFDGRNGLAFGAAMRLHDNIQLNGSIGYGLEENIAGGRMGVRLGW